MEPRQANRRNLHRRSLVLAFGGLWRAREREPIMGVWGLCPQRGPGAESLVRGSGGLRPLKLNASKLRSAHRKAQIWPCLRDFSVVYTLYKKN